MMKKRLKKLGPAAAIGIGAGIAAAVLCSLATRATIPAEILANLSPLPIMIAMLGYGTIAGATAVVSAAFTVSILFYAHEKFGNLDTAALAGLTFLFFLGLPAFWLSLLAVLSRVKGSPNWVVTTRVGSFFAREYCPLERVLSYATSLCATIGVAIAIYVSSQFGGFDIAVERLTAEIAPFVDQLIGSRMQLPKGVDANSLARATVLAAAPMVAGCSLIMMMLNLWLAGRVAQLSGQLPRPWPDIPWELRLPRIYLLVFGLAAAIGPYLGGLPGLIVVIVATTLGVAYALVGLAVAHYLPRGSSFRIPLLAAIYVGLAIPVTWLVFLLALVVVGILDTAFSLRDRKKKAAEPKP
ncbi:MAG TPA: hypothetical protein VFC11_04220 [Methylocella sp.]|nr:hypothetical protein [Methylocella sp.]